MFRAQSAHHQEVNDAKCTYAASGIVTLCKWLSCASAKLASQRWWFQWRFAAILVNCAPSGETHNYCTLHIINENSENFLIHLCNYILLSQVYCVWQIVKTSTVIFNNPVYSFGYMFWFCENIFRPYNKYWSQDGLEKQRRIAKTMYYWLYIENYRYFK